MLTLSGNTTVQYGTYGVGSSPEVINASTISQALTQMQQQGVNSSYIDQLIAQLPYANLTVSKLSLNATYGSGSATIFGGFQVTGNLSTLAPALASADTCKIYAVSGLTSTSTSYSNTTSNSLTNSSSSTSNATSSTTSSSTSTSITTSSTSNQKQCIPIYSAYAVIFSSYQSYSYNMTYSNGLTGFEATLQSSQNLGITKADQTLQSMEPNQTIISSETQFLNQTKVDLSGFQLQFSEVQQANGNYTTSYEFDNLTMYPPIVRNGNEFNMSALFNFLSEGSNSTIPGSVTIKGGSDSAGSVSLIIPSGVPVPTSKTTDSATWSSVPFSSLASVEFSVSQATSTATTSSSLSGSSTVSSTSQTTASSSSSSTQSSQNSSLITYAAVAAVAGVAIAVIAAFLLRRH